MSDAARRAGPAWQRAVAAWPTRAAPTPRFKAVVGTARRASRQLTSSASPSPQQRPHARRSPNRLTSLIPTAPTPGPKPTVAVRAPRPSLPGRLRRREHDHGERRPSSPLVVLRPWSIELTLPSLLTVAGPPPATVAPPHRRNAAAEPDFFSSPSMRSSGELAFHPPCPAGSLTIVGARPSPFAPSPPLWRHRRSRRDAWAALAEAGPASVGRARVAVGRAHAVRVGRADAAGVGRAWFRPRGTQFDFSIF
jgi:hypothetical protein